MTCRGTASYPDWCFKWGYRTGALPLPPAKTLLEILLALLGGLKNPKNLHSIKQTQGRGDLRSLFYGNCLLRRRTVRRMLMQMQSQTVA